MSGYPCQLQQCMQNMGIQHAEIEIMWKSATKDGIVFAGASEKGYKMVIYSGFSH